MPVFFTFLPQILHVNQTRGIFWLPFSYEGGKASWASSPVFIATFQGCTGSRWGNLCTIGKIKMQPCTFSLQADCTNNHCFCKSPCFLRLLSHCSGAQDIYCTKGCAMLLLLCNHTEQQDGRTEHLFTLKQVPHLGTYLLCSKCTWLRGTWRYVKCGSI